MSRVPRTSFRNMAIHFSTTIAGMKINQLSNRELRRALRATERATGPDSYEVRVFRRELARRRPKRSLLKKIARSHDRTK